MWSILVDHRLAMPADPDTEAFHGHQFDEQIARTLGRQRRLSPALECRPWEGGAAIL